MRTLNLRHLESSVWRTVHQDGLLDLFFGLLFFVSALSMYLDASAVSDAIRLSLTLPIYGGGIVAFWALKRYVARTRSGTAVFRRQRRRRVWISRAALGCGVVATLGLLGLTLASRVSAEQVLPFLGDFASSAMIGTVILASLVALAIALDAPRIVIHAVLFVGAEFATVALSRVGGLSYPGTLAFGFAGLFSTAIGLYVFLRFLRLVPRHDPEITEERP